MRDGMRIGTRHYSEGISTHETYLNGHIIGRRGNNRSNCVIHNRLLSRR